MKGRGEWAALSWKLGELLEERGERKVSVFDVDKRKKVRGEMKEENGRVNKGKRMRGAHPDQKREDGFSGGGKRANSSGFSPKKRPKTREKEMLLSSNV
jgi:hypothetical protein